MSQPVGRSRHAIVVFGRSLDAFGQVSPGLERRLAQTLAEAERHPDAFVVVSGGSVRGSVSEARAMHRWLVDRGLRPERIVLEAKSRNTLENAEFVAPILSDRKVRQVTLVTEDFHMDRSRKLLSSALTHVRAEAAIAESRAPDELTGVGKLHRAALEKTQYQRHRVMQTFRHVHPA